MFWKKIIVSRIFVKKAKSPMQIRIANNSVLIHTEIIEELQIEIGGVQCFIPILWSTN